MYGTSLIGKTTQVYGRRQIFIRLPIRGIRFRRYRFWNVSSLIYPFLLEFGYRLDFFFFI